MAGRLDDWRAVLDHVERREPLDRGVRASFDRSTPLQELMRLTAAEYECCQFFDFAITVDNRGIALEVRAPDDALADRVLAVGLRRDRPTQTRRRRHGCVWVAACVACCAGPIIGVMGAIGLGTVVGVLLFGVAGVAIGAIGLAVLVHRRRRTSRACESADVQVPVEMPTVRSTR